MGVRQPSPRLAALFFMRSTSRCAFLTLVKMFRAKKKGPAHVPADGEPVFLVGALQLDICNFHGCSRRVANRDRCYGNIGKRDVRHKVETPQGEMFKPRWGRSALTAPRLGAIHRRWANELALPTLKPAERRTQFAAS